MLTIYHMPPPKESESLQDPSYPVAPEFRGESLVTSLKDLREWVDSRAESYRSFLDENGFESHSFSTVAAMSRACRITAQL